MEDAISSGASSLLSVVAKARLNKTALYIRFRHGAELLILGSKDIYLQKDCSLEDLISVPSEALDIVETDANAPQLSELHNKGRPLSELIWVLTSAWTVEQKSDACKKTDVYQLSRWPNLTRLPHRPTAFLVAALLGKQPHSCRIIASKLKIPIEDVYEFCAPALQGGYIEPAGRALECSDADLIQKPSSSFLSSVLSRLQR